MENFVLQFSPKFQIKLVLSIIDNKKYANHFKICLAIVLNCVTFFRYAILNN